MVSSTLLGLENIFLKALGNRSQARHGRQVLDTCKAVWERVFISPAEMVSRATGDMRSGTEALKWIRGWPVDSDRLLRSLGSDP